MIKTLVNAIKDQAEHIKGIKFFRYEGYDLINSQNNNATIQIWVEDNIYTEYLTTKDLVKIQVNINILDKLTDDITSLDIHNNTTNIGIVLMKLLENKYNISITDYSFVNMSRFTDDSLYGVRLSLYLLASSPMNECNIKEYIDMTNEYEIYYQYNNTDIIYPEIDINDIDINPIKLNKNGK